jgi:hypothetical protein
LDSSSTTFVRRACRGDELTLFCNARLRRARVNRSGVDGARSEGCLPRTAEAFGFELNSRASAAAEVLFVQNLLWRFLKDQSSCSSHAVEDLDSPQHDDDGQYQRGHRQYTLQGSDSHATHSASPAPRIRLADSLIRRQLARHNRFNIVAGCALWGTYFA